jgi:hypothetical protein
MGGDFQQFRSSVSCGRSECVYTATLGMHQLLTAIRIFNFVKPFPFKNKRGTLKIIRAVSPNYRCMCMP